MFEITNDKVRGEKQMTEAEIDEIVDGALLKLNDDEELNRAEIAAIQYRITEIMENVSEYDLDDSDLFSLVKLIVATKDASFIAKTIVDKELGFDSVHKLLLIEGLRRTELPEQEYYMQAYEYMQSASVGLESRDKYLLLKNMKSMEYAKERYNYNDGLDFTEYERIIYHATTSPEIGLADKEKVELIKEEAGDYRFIAYCTNSIPLPSHDKCELIKDLKTSDGMTPELYLAYLSAIILPDYEKVGIESKDFIELVKDARKFGTKDEQQSDIPNPEYTRLVYQVLTDNKLTLSGNEKTQLICSANDAEFSKSILLGKTPIQVPQDSIAKIVTDTKDKEFIHEIYLGNFPTIKLSEHEMASVIASTKDKEYIESVLNGSQINTHGYRAKPALLNIILREEASEIPYEEWERYYDEVFQKVVIEGKYGFSEIQQTELIETTKYYCPEHERYALQNFKDEFACVALARYSDDKQLVREYLDAHPQMDVENRRVLIKALDNEEEMKEFDSHVYRIGDVSELSAEELEKMPDIVAVKIENENTRAYQQALYAKQDYIAIRREMDKTLEGVEAAEKGNPESELKTFLAVYQRLAEKISYDHEAITPEGRENSLLQRNCRNLKGGIIDNQCVCAGYAEILRNALALKGIECKYIQGTSEEAGGGGHAWNQVKIGNNWFNVDLTWDRRAIAETKTVGPEVLKTDAEFEDHKEFSLYRSDEEKCDVSINAVMINRAKNQKAEQEQHAGLQESVENIGIRKEILPSEITRGAAQIRRIEQELPRKEKEQILKDDHFER